MKILINILTVAIVALFLKLSIWQWHRYHYKLTLQQTYAEQMQAVPQALDTTIKQLMQNPDQIGYQKVFAKGHYENQQFLLDNRTKNNQVGFDVITPFKLTDGETILVDRGFVPANVNRQIMQDITPPDQTIEIKGLLTKPTKSFVLGSVIEPQTTVKWPMMIMRIDPPILAAPLNDKLLPYVILLNAHEPNGFLREWSPPDLWAQRSLGYCFQWIALALTVIIVYFVMHRRKKEKAHV